MAEPAWVRSFFARLGSEHGESLFDRVLGVQFWIKDARGRYVRVNHEYLANYAFRERDIVGRRDREIFPVHLARQYERDDARVLRGAEVHGRTELVLRRDHTPAWHQTHKIPLTDRRGRIVGTAGITFDLRGAPLPSASQRELLPLMDHLRAHLAGPLGKAALARRAGVSVRTLERRFIVAFGLSPARLREQARAQEACRLLATTGRAIGDIALELGYADHSHFGRAFRRATGLAPRSFRSRNATKIDPGSAASRQPTEPRRRDDATDRKR